MEINILPLNLAHILERMVLEIESLVVTEFKSREYKERILRYRNLANEIHGIGFTHYDYRHGITIQDWIQNRDLEKMFHGPCN